MASSLMTAKYEQDKMYALTGQLYNKITELKLMAVLQQKHIRQLEESLFEITQDSVR